MLFHRDLKIFHFYLQAFLLQQQVFSILVQDHTEALVSMLCPACGTHLNAPLGSVQCRECQARFRIELDEPGTTAPRIGDRERSSPAIQPKPGT